MGASLAARLGGGRGLAVGVVALALLATAAAVRVRGRGEDAAPRLDRPNIVFVLTDDQSMDSVARMPYVSSRADWVQFDNAFLNVSLCCPSRATILGGQYSHHSGVERNDDGDVFRDADTVATWLQDAGYRTGLVGKYLNGYPWDRGNYVPPGWDDWRVFTKVGYFDYALNENGTIHRRGSTPADYSTDVLARKAKRFISEQDDPFFLMVAPNAPHGPRLAAPRHRPRLRGTPMPRPANFNEVDVSDKPAWVRALPPRDERRMDSERRKQYRSLLAVDDLVRELFGALDEKGVLDETVMVFMTDNGYSFGEHRYTRKICAYEECVRTPLLVRYPGQDGKRVAALAQNVDMAATFADLAGAEPTIAQDGRSLVPLVRGVSTPWRSAVLLRWAGHEGDAVPAPGTGVEIPAFWGLRTQRHKYVELETGERELYDLRSDPRELRNRAADASSAQLVARLSAQLARLKGG